MAQSRLVDTGVAYATPKTVQDYFKNEESFETSGDIPPDRLEEWILDASDEVDRITGRAWRERKVLPQEFGVNFSRKQRRTMQNRRPGSRITHRVDPWGMITLPHQNVRIDPNEGDAVEILLPRAVEDITADKGREDGKYIVAGPRGVVKVNVTEFRRGPHRLEGTGVMDDPTVRIAYRYGQQVDTTTLEDGVVIDSVANVPGGVKRATAMLVAAELVDSDQYSDLVPGGDAAPDQENSADKYEERAEKRLKRYKYKKVM